MPIKKLIAAVDAAVAKLNKHSNALLIIATLSIIFGSIMMISASWLSGLAVIFNGLMVGAIAINLRDEGL